MMAAEKEESTEFGTDEYIMMQFMNGGRPRRPGNTSHVHRITPEVALELIVEYEGEDPNFAFETDEDGLILSLDFSKLTGRIVIHREDKDDASTSSSFFSANSVDEHTNQQQRKQRDGKKATGLLERLFGKQAPPLPAVMESSMEVASTSTKEPYDFKHESKEPWEAPWEQSALDRPATPAESEGESGPFSVFQDEEQKSSNAFFGAAFSSMGFSELSILQSAQPQSVGNTVTTAPPTPPSPNQNDNSSYNSSSDDDSSDDSSNDSSDDSSDSSQEERKKKSPAKQSKPPPRRATFAVPRGRSSSVGRLKPFFAGQSTKSMGATSANDKPFPLTKEDSGLSSHGNQSTSTNNERGTLKKQHGGILSTIFHAGDKLKRSIPDHIRSRRREKIHYSIEEDEDDVPPPPTPLHTLCDEPDVELQELLDCWTSNPGAVKIKDHKGRFPLHILGDNETLVSSNRSVATSFGKHLINEYPDAVITSDLEGNMPFFSIIMDWYKWAIEDSKKFKNTHSSRNSNSSRGSDAEKYSKNFCYPGSSITSSRNLFPRVEIWVEVEWAFTMLSTALDVLARNMSMPTFRLKRSRHAVTNYSKGGSGEHEPKRNYDADDRTILVEALTAKIPRLLYTVLLLDEDGLDSRTRCLEQPLFRRMLLCPQIVGKWLTNMLNHGGVPAERAVDFLHLISHTTIDDYTGGNYGTPLPNDWDHYKFLKQSVFDKVGELKGAIASLVTLNVKETERAATTAVIWETMGDKLCRPFVLGLVLMDLVLHVSLMVTFRNTAGVKPAIRNATSSGIFSQGIIYTIGSHYLIREASQAWAMFSVSRGALHGYMSDWWNIFGLVAIVLTIVTTFLNGKDPTNNNNGLNAFIVGLLWVKVLAFLKVVNKEMATFILALSQILYDIRFFMVVLIVCVFMFGDMFHLAVSGKDGGTWCDNNPYESGSIDDFCTSTWDSYLRVYSILLGDFELDNIRATPGTTILFVTFTVFGVIILLNVLIAIISDSYEKATLSGHALFGRARVMFVAQNEALERFLKPKKRLNRDNNLVWSWMKRLGRWGILSAILVTALLTEFWLISVTISFAGHKNAQDLAYFFLVMFLSLLLGAALWVVATFLLDEPFRWLLPDRTEFVYDAVDTVNNGLVRIISGALFGLEREKVDITNGSSRAKEQHDSEWNGRMHYMERAVGAIILEAKRELKAEMQEIKKEVHDIGNFSWMKKDSPKGQAPNKVHHRSRSRAFTIDF